MAASLDELLLYVAAEHRVCPAPQRWNDLWEMLPGRRRVGAGWLPPLPLILGAWHYTSALEKMVRLREHLEYASDHGVLDEVDAFVRQLPESDWYHVSEI